MNKLPNDIWNLCCNYFTQSEYRCTAILINQQCFKLSHSIHHSCLPREHVILLVRKQTIAEAQNVLLRVQPPIKHLEVDEACILYSTQFAKQLQLHTLLSQIHSLTFLPSATNSIHTASLIHTFNQMPALQYLSFHCSLFDMLDIDQGVQYSWEFNEELYESNVQQMAHSLRHIRSLSINDYFQQGYNTLLYRIIQSPPLHVLRLDSIWFNDDDEIVQFTTNGCADIREIYLTRCHHSRISPFSVSMHLNRYQYLRILNVYHCRGHCFTPQYILPEIKSLRHLESLSLSEWYAADIHGLLACAFVTTLKELYLFDFAHVSSTWQLNASKQYIQCRHLQSLLLACTNLSHLWIEFRHYSLPSNDHKNNFFSSFVTTPTTNNNTLQSVCFILNDPKQEIDMDRFILLFCQCALALKEFKLCSQPAWWTRELQDCFDTNAHEEDMVGGYFKPFYRHQFIRKLHTCITSVD